MTPARTLVDDAVQLLWSHWSELGVPGARVAASRSVISPVDLILYTPSILRDRDARLAGLVQAWCAQHGERAVGARELSARAATLPAPAAEAFHAWTSVLHEAAGAPWPPRPHASPVAAPPIDDRDLPFRADRRRAVVLRARSLFGVGVRADLVCALLKAHAEGRPLSSPELAHLGHSARALQLALGAFEAAGVVHAEKGARTYTYVLTNPTSLTQLLDAEDLNWFPWHHALPIVFHLVAFATQASADPRLQHVMAHTVAGTLAPHAHAVHGLPVVPVRPGDEDAHERLMQWGAAALAMFIAT